MRGVCHFISNGSFLDAGGLLKLITSVGSHMPLKNMKFIKSILDLCKGVVPGDHVSSTSSIGT